MGDNNALVLSQFFLGNLLILHGFYIISGCIVTNFFPGIFFSNEWKTAKFLFVTTYTLRNALKTLNQCKDQRSQISMIIIKSNNRYTVIQIFLPEGLQNLTLRAILLAVYMLILSCRNSRNSRSTRWRIHDYVRPCPLSITCLSL